MAGRDVTSIYICFLRPRIVATPTHVQHTPWMQYTVCRVLHQESSLNLTKEHGSIFATCKDWRIWSRGEYENGEEKRTYGLLGVEVDRCDCTLVAGQLRGTCISFTLLEGIERGHTLYTILPLSTSQIHTILSAPPTAARRPLSSLLHAARNSVFSKPAGAPLKTRWIRLGEGENGRTSWTMVCEENEGERRYEPFGEREREVGVSVCPVRVYTCSFLRIS